MQKPLLFGAGGMLAGAMAAVALLPTAELLGRSMRSEPTYRFSAEYSLLPRNFITLLMPEFLDWSGTEFRIYAGILTLALALVAWTVTRRSRSELRFYLTVMIAATVVALGGFTIFQGFAYNYLPGFGQVRVSVRAFFFANFALSVMAAFGAETLLRQLDDMETTRLAQLVRYSRRLIALGGAVAILLYLLLVWISLMEGVSSITMAAVGAVCQAIFPQIPYGFMTYGEALAVMYLLLVITRILMMNAAPSSIMMALVGLAC